MQHYQLLTQSIKFIYLIINVMLSRYPIFKACYHTGFKIIYPIAKEY